MTPHPIASFLRAMGAKVPAFYGSSADESFQPATEAAG